MSGHQSTADMVNNELNQLQEMQPGSLDAYMAEINPNPDFSTAPDIHCSLEVNTCTDIRTDISMGSRIRPSEARTMETGNKI